MNIIQINGTFGVSDSTGRNVKDIHEYLLAHGYSSYVFCTRINDDSSWSQNILKYSFVIDQYMHSFLSHLTDKQGFFSRYSTMKLLKMIESKKPDIVVLNVLHNNSINFPLLCNYLAKNNIATVLVLHDCWYYTGHCCHYTDVNCQKWKKNCGKCPQLHAWNKSWFVDRSTKNLKDKYKWFKSIPRLAVVGVSNWITDEAKKSILKQVRLITRIYNWVDLDIFKPQDTSELRQALCIEKHTKILLGVASNWNSQKGLKEILLVADKIPDVKVIIIGSISVKMRVPSNVILIGSVKDANKLAKFYALADVFLNPSRQETFGKTTAEALSCGTPAIVYNTTACPELIGKGCGKVVPAFDEMTYVAMVQKQLHENNLYTIEKCRKFARDNFSMDKSMKEYVKIFKRLLNTDRV